MEYSEEYPPMLEDLEYADPQIVDKIKEAFSGKIEFYPQVLIDEKNTRFRTKTKEVGFIQLTYNIDTPEVLHVKSNVRPGEVSDGWVRWEDLKEYITQLSQLKFS
jgi:hypothetical protein